jgi:hypothetical protein
LPTHVDTARDVALEMAARRIPFLCTILMTAHFEVLLRWRDPGYDWWLGVTMELLSRCDAVFAIPGWETSNGATREVEWARANDKPVFEDIDELSAWLALPA